MVASPGVGGADQEPLATAIGRAAETVWAHERLTELLERAAQPSLDQLGRDAVVARAAPARATTLADYERLALEVPGTRIRRARAWAGIDPRYPGLQAPGTVTLVVVPELPRRAPRPGPGLLREVRAYLERHRLVGTRLAVVGPRYATLTVKATVRALAGADPEWVRREVVARLDTLLDPLRGGPRGAGWPFGRDVYRAEILQAIDGVSGVDHVLTLSLLDGSGVEQWGNVCVGPTELVLAGRHELTVVRP
jgi:predicted phage baseplate assembly protein